jgi:trigger factor
LNIQTERLANHTARLTVPIDLGHLDQAKQEAARKISRKVNIPGFRKGKVPYRVLVQYIGEGAIMEEAIEILSNSLYKKSLDAADVEPYGPGTIEDFKLEPEPHLVFIVPMQPTVDLDDYRSVRLEYSAPTVEDEQVNKAMRQLLEQHAVIEESREQVAPGNRVTMELYAKMVEEAGEVKAEAAEASSEEAHEHGEEHEHEHHHDHGLGENEFIHEHSAVMILGDENEEPAPGFKQALMGAKVDEERVFELRYPEDDENYEEYAGKKAEFKVKMLKIETVTLPSLNDDFAARVTEKEEKPLTLLELRMRMRENLQTAMENDAKSRFSADVLDMVVEKATVSFPDAMVDDQSEDYLKRMDQELRRQKMTLDDYVRISGKSRDDLKADYRDSAVRNIKRGLVLREVMKAEKIEVPDSKIEDEINKLMERFGEQSANLRSALDTPTMRANIKDDLLQQEVLDRIAAIAKGEAPALSVEETTPTPSPETAEGETAQ